MTRHLNISDIREAARRRLPKAFFEFLDRGTEDEEAMVANRAALSALRLKPAVLKDVRRIDTSTDILGRKSPLPFAIAPTGSAGMLAWRGELAVARAAGRAGIPYTLATSSTSTIEEIAAVATGGMWLQLYVWDDREASLEIVDRAARAGAEALLITVDTPVMANREYNERNGFSFPVKPRPLLVADILSHPRWFAGVLAKYWMTGGMPHYANYPRAMSGPVTQAPPRRANSASVTWDDIGRFRDRWRGKLVLKGVLDPADAVRAADIGADAVVVSNHGGRMFDAAPSSIEALPGVVAAAGDRLDVLFDGGIRRGTDIMRALALGARAVLIGRAPLYGVAAEGEAGVARVIEILADELERSMALAGTTSVGAISRDCIWCSQPTNG
ncbi:alpha-hydroxy acid oxidase [Oricola sp.]|uniref:alpha-hydroxy acid oxidase n=1 Tax=Oricola sp. TaxID=1979950 RepID=UPI0025D8BD68|nr:alpha-hydroxy acid oxidase [Oricola sp.]MCI5074147.1 alpha-hydroxy-acid oxidizing protein [Oricola sp.]